MLIKLLLQGSYHNKRVEQDYPILQQWNIVESKLINSLKHGRWPKLNSEAKNVIKLIQAEICYHSLNNANEKAMKRIESYSMNILLRFISINIIDSKPDTMSEYPFFKEEKDKILLLFETKETKFKKFSEMTVKIVRVSRVNKIKNLGISSIFDKVLQKQLCLVLDPYYEAKFSENMYGFRKGRNAIQAVGYLRVILARTNPKSSGLLLINIEKYFDNISYNSILTHFKIPKKWIYLLLRWLQGKIISAKGTTLGVKTKGILFGSIVDPTICNIIIWVLFKKIITSKLSIFKNLKTNLRLNWKFFKKKQSNVYRDFIIYADDIIITTKNRNEFKSILLSLSKAFSTLGLKSSASKTQIVTYSKNEKIKFKYLGFVFFYVHLAYVKKGGLLTRKDVINKKYEKTKLENYLIYPCLEELHSIKVKLKKIIRLVLRRNIIAILKYVNPIVRDYTSYYSWSDGLNRLQRLDRLLFRNFKKYLICKFRYGRIRKFTCFAKKFFVCKWVIFKAALNLTKVLFTSPYGLRWHLHYKLPHTKVNPKSTNLILFLVLATNYTKILHCTKTILPRKWRNRPYYFFEGELSLWSVRLQWQRTNTCHFKEQLFNIQKGSCPSCKLILINKHKDNITFDIFGNSLQIHPKKAISTAKKVYKIKHKVASILKDFVLLHKTCHFKITKKASY